MPAPLDQRATKDVPLLLGEGDTQTVSCAKASQYVHVASSPGQQCACEPALRTRVLWRRFRRPRDDVNSIARFADRFHAACFPILSILRSDRKQGRDLL